MNDAEMPFQAWLMCKPDMSCWGRRTHSAEQDIPLSCMGVGTMAATLSLMPHRRSWQVWIGVVPEHASITVSSCRLLQHATVACQKT